MLQCHKSSDIFLHFLSYLQRDIILLTIVQSNWFTNSFIQQQRMDQYFVQMVKIAEERKSRIKFTLKDAIELRQVCTAIRGAKFSDKSGNPDVIWLFQ